MYIYRYKKMRILYKKKLIFFLCKFVKSSTKDVHLDSNFQARDYMGFH